MHLLFNTATKRWLWVLVVGAILALAAGNTPDLHAIGLLLFLGSLCALGLSALKKGQLLPKGTEKAPICERIEVPAPRLARKSATNTVDWKNRR
jgi:hypothetical protein